MRNSVFFEVEFLALVASSFLLPTAIYVFLLIKRSISKFTVLVFSLVLIGLSGLDVVLLNVLGTMAKASESLLDDRVFSTEIALTLYLLPAVFAGLGVNLLSHVLIRHLGEAEAKHERTRRGPAA